MKPNPPIPGHELLFEGGTQPIWGEGWGSVKGHKGGCACGAQPPDFPDVSNNKMKAWHREHKAELRGEVADHGEQLAQAVRDAANGNIIVFSEQGMRPEYQLDTAQFIKDLYAAGWEIVHRG